MHNRIGVLVTAAYICCLLSIIPESVGANDQEKFLSIFPILMYDTNIGIGCGAKAKFVQYLARKELFYCG